MKFNNVLNEAIKYASPEDKAGFDSLDRIARARGVTTDQILGRRDPRKAAGWKTTSAPPPGIEVYKAEFQSVATVNGKTKYLDKLELSAETILSQTLYRPIARIVDDIKKSFSMYVHGNIKSFIEPNPRPQDLVIYYNSDGQYIAIVREDSGSKDIEASKEISNILNK